MATPHISAKLGDFANVVLMPGDPLRARWIAETYLKDCEKITDVRGILGYTGLTANGKRISVMASGMGQPSIGIYSYELYSAFNVDTIIRVGTCGSYQENINLFDVLVCSSASTDSNWGDQYGIKGCFAPCADFNLLRAAVEACEAREEPYHVGNILSSDVFYDDDKETWRKWKRLGVMGVEMESYALYCNAAKLNKRALCLLTVTDSFINETQKATPDERAYGLKHMVEVAIAAAEKFAK